MNVVGQEALLNAKHLVYNSLHRGLSLQEILRCVARANSILTLEAIDKYATVLLFQPGLEEGIDPVIQVFEIKYAVYSKYLERSLAQPVFFNANLDPLNVISIENLPADRR